MTQMPAVVRELHWRSTEQAVLSCSQAMPLGVPWLGLLAWRHLPLTIRRDAATACVDPSRAGSMVVAQASIFPPRNAERRKPSKRCSWG